ncbi:hypothetical protein [Bradyrhizobium sp. SZCCHNR2012]|uniref:DUF7940 domain-containing protein n=1 Tax=Bradyrhizobium sp. SZCCHNR2012 TaxID=3057377 RepID=UPI0028F01CA3|nr:hypothetical protein [Bradyrhizobium sp. SZCCHNR2012]
MRLIDNWRRELLRLHSMRAAIAGAAFWSAVGGAIMIWPALADHIPTAAYAAGGVVLSVAFGVARLLKQPGAE